MNEIEAARMSALMSNAERDVALLLFGVATIRGLAIQNGDVVPAEMRDTPRRVVAALLEMTRGYQADVAALLSVQFDAEHYDEVVALSGIEFTSLCEHHLLPFRGTAAVAYLPQAKVVGLSKLARVVDAFAMRFQMQERMTSQIADAIESHLLPRGTAVIVRAHHACMGCRGVMKPSAVMTTSSVRGVFREDEAARVEVMQLMEV